MLLGNPPGPPRPPPRPGSAGVPAGGPLGGPPLPGPPAGPEGGPTNAAARWLRARSISPRRSERTATYRPTAAASTASATDRLATAAIRVRSVTAGHAPSRLAQDVADAADRVDQLARA